MWTDRGSLRFIAAVNAAELATYRNDRKRFFADDCASPLPEEARETFSGLRFYPYEPELEMQVMLHRAERTTQIAHDGYVGC